MMLALATVMVACSGEQSNEEVETAGDKTSSTVQGKEERQAEIQVMEQELLGFAKSDQTKMMNAKADILLKRYRDYISMNPRDSMTSEYLFKAADLSVGVGKPEAAISYLDRLIQDFPSFRKAPEMMLFRGFIYETYMNQHADAVKAYKALIERYPNHRLASDARASIENLTMSEDELIEKFKKMNQE